MDRAEGFAEFRERHEASGLDVPARGRANFVDLFPVGVPNQKAYALMKPDVAANLSTAPQYLPKELFVNAKWWTDNLDAVNRRLECYRRIERRRPGARPGLIRPGAGLGIELTGHSFGGGKGSVHETGGTIDHEFAAQDPRAADDVWRRLASRPGGPTFDLINPATAELFARVPLGGAADASAAVDAAHAAFPAWSRRTAADRALLIHRVADRLEARREEIAAAITLEEGKPLLESRFEMRLTIDSLPLVCGGGAPRLWQLDPRSRAQPAPSHHASTLADSSAVVPWNVPAAMITRKAGPALATGCTMVLKPAEQTPVTATLIAEAFLEADLPPGVFNVVTGDAPAIGQAFLSDERVRKISFTGSTEVGRLLLRGSAEHIKRVSLELGGNAPVILFEDCNLDRAIPALCALKFLNAGQACISANRIYVQASIHDAVAERLQAYAGKLKVGDGMAEGVGMGPLIEAEALAKVDGLVKEAGGAGRIASGRRHAG